MTDQEEADIPPKLQWKGGRPDPNLIPDSSDNVERFLHLNKKGLQRVSVQWNKSGQAYPVINGFRVDAELDKDPKISDEDILRGIMAIAQDHFETRGEPTRYRVMFFVQKKKTGGVKKPVCMFELGGEAGETEVTGAEKGENMTEQAMRMNNDLHDRLLKANDIVARLAEKAMDSQAQIFESHEKIMDARLEGDRTIAAMAAEKSQLEAQGAKFDRGMKLLEELIDNGVGEALAGGLREQFGIKGKSGGSVKQIKEAAKDTDGALPVPSWASAAAPALPEKSDDPETDEPPTDESQEEQPDMDPIDPTLPRLVKKAQKLFRSIEHDQWPAIIQILPDEKLQILRAFATVQTEQRVHEMTRELDLQDLGDEKEDLLMDTLTAFQMTSLLQLRRAAKRAE